jgi:hypothetical protein
MNKRPGHVEVTTEVNYCSFCDRVRNLRREEHHLGTLVSTVITMGVATVEAPATPEAPATSEVEGEAKPQPAKRTATRKAEPASPKPKAAKSRSTKPK